MCDFGEPNMTPDKFQRLMAEIKGSMSGDPENAHIKADELMCDILDSMGYGGGIGIFKDMERWYA